MNAKAEKVTALPSTEWSAAEIAAQVRTLRAVLDSIPANQRAAVLEQVADLIPKTPKRGGEILNNVYDLFKREPTVDRKAPEIQAELKRAGKDADPQAVRNALTYLESRKVLQRIGYGLYRMGDGSLRRDRPDEKAERRW